ncbi:type I polyketide synthase [Mycobacterium sp. 1274761.0]|uniref:type I polyketide synthase n=1 Tax=Mycobacterium sp. 1274761.0 TaxID=1834077 RepID=UPI0007FBD592|nr:type I polyketide synthase [Mycobacterium sp. 1274761.0]OBK76783.1 polyketide synthase [Mycobacterium sp. 1274761.0]
MQTPEPLAIVGIGCRFPGGVDSQQSFWQMLCDDVDATRDVPGTRWDAARYHDPNPAKLGKIVTRRGGFLDQIDQFDPQFFGISPREAHSLDPQQRLLLQVAWEALEDGGVPADQLAGTDVGVFIGGFTLDYQLLQNQGRASRYRFKPHSATGMMMTMLANRISFAFDFRGPSMSVDTACSSSLVAVHLAAQSIWNGECHHALAGGVNIMIGPNTAIAESKSGFLSPEGRSKAFDDSADGYARGEGGAVVLIKPVEHAVRDGDHIYAQILGSAVSQDGHTDGITVPRGEAQEAAITAALRRAGVAPGEVGYVEAHGTGTPVGDPIEMRALAGALATQRPAARPLLIGSVKTNIGHLEAGAGIAGLIKAALVLQHGYVPANLHLRRPTRQVCLDDLNIDIPAAGRPFPACLRRIAGVNSFGFGGTNAHVVLAEPPSAPPAARHEIARPLPVAVLPISARSSEALAETAGRLAEQLAADDDIALTDLAYTLSRRRTHHTYRQALIAETVADAEEQLRAVADGGQIPAARTEPSASKLAFVCTGMGPQWWRMCRGLLDVFPAFTDSILRSDKELSRYADWSLVDELRCDETRSRMGETEIAQPANFAIQVALARQLAEFGIVPDALVGHSAGEVAAHHLAGLLTFEQAIEVIYHRSRLQQRTSGRGRMLAVGLDADSLLQTLDGELESRFGQGVSVAAVNSPSALTIAGDDEVLDEIARQLDKAGVFSRMLAVKVPYHTHYMDVIKDDLFEALDGLSSDDATVPLFSTVTGERLHGYRAGAAYWWQNIRASVLFEPAVRRMLDDGYTHFVELGPHPVLAAPIVETAGSQRVSVIAAQRRDHDDARTLMMCVAALHCHGHDVDWDAVNPRSGARYVKLPSYPWQTKRYWDETHEAEEALYYRPVHPLLGQPVRAVHPTWEAELNPVTNRWLQDHRVQGSVVVPAAVYVEMALAAAKLTYGSDHSVDNLVLHRAVILDETCDPVLRTTLNEADGSLEFAAFTATADGDLKWAITATAELTTLPVSRGRDETPDGAGPLTTTSGEDFYRGTQALGFGYGDAFRSVVAVTAGHDWAVADITVPDGVADDLDDYRFHPVLVDGAFQTLFCAPFSGHEDTNEPYLPTRVRHCAVYGSPQPHMRVHVRVLSATREAVECDIAITDPDGNRLAVFEGFAVQSLGASARMSLDRIDRALYELEWSPKVFDNTAAAIPDADVPGTGSWLILADASGVGARLADELRRRGQKVRCVESSDSDFAARLDQSLERHLGDRGGLTGIVDCWPLDMPARAEQADQLGAFTVLRLVKALAAHGSGAARLHVVTGNAQPAPGTDLTGADQAALWGLGRVIGHQEFPELWGGLIDIDPNDDCERSAARICAHLLGASPEDQIAIRGDETFVPRLRICRDLTKPFPTKLSADATYIVTGGTGALGRVVAGYLAERGARHIVLMGRSTFPDRTCWAAMTKEDRHFTTVEAIRAIERLGTQISVASVDITDAEQMTTWRDHHVRQGGRPVRGIIHAAGAVDDKLLINMSEADYAAVVAAKITGTRVLHSVFGQHDLEFFVMFGSAGSTVASPGQANYAAANAFLDAFAYYRQSQGRPALTIGWGPWSVGMVEELKLENTYAQRGIELITPALGTRILDRLIGQKVPHVVAISADWNRARSAGLSQRLPLMFADLEHSGSSSAQPDSGASLLDVLADAPEADRPTVVAEHLGRIVADVFDCAVSDIEPDDVLDDLGLDSMMAMDLRVRVNTIFSIDLPVLEILRGVSVNSLSARVLAELRAIHGETLAAATDLAEEQSPATDADVEQLVDGLSESELRELLADLEADATAPEAEVPNP